MLSNLGLTVSREIPLEFLANIASGAYTVHGGVIRDGLGRIVSHLALSGDPSGLSSLVPGLNILERVASAGQLYAIGRNVKDVQETVSTALAYSVAGTTLSGLGLVTSVTGFAYLNRRLNKIDARLTKLEKQVKAIKALIQSQYKAQLHTAIDNLRQAEETNDTRLRHDLLMQSKIGFTTQSHYYRDVWESAGEIDEVDGVDEYLTIAFMGAAIATSELGMGKVATSELQRHYGEWRTLARTHCERHLFGNGRSRLLEAELVQDLPARDLVDTLDFVHETNRGIDWVDELRKESTSYITRAITTLPGWPKQSVLAAEKARIGLAKRLRSRDAVLNANVAHFAFLAEKGTSVVQFSADVNRALGESAGQPICIHRAA